MNRLALDAEKVLALQRGEEIEVVTQDERLRGADLVSESKDDPGPGGSLVVVRGGMAVDFVERPHTPGERYFVGEAHKNRAAPKGIKPQRAADGEMLRGEARAAVCRAFLDQIHGIGDPSFLPADKMPREASRLTVECVGVEVSVNATSRVPLRDSGVPTDGEHVFISTFRVIQ